MASLGRVQNCTITLLLCDGQVCLAQLMSGAFSTFCFFFLLWSALSLPPLAARLLSNSLPSCAHHRQRLDHEHKSVTLHVPLPAPHAAHYQYVGFAAHSLRTADPFATAGCE